MKITNAMNSFSRLRRLLLQRMAVTYAEEGREMICPKCGTSRQPIGPRYSLDGWGHECMRYACHGCGYSWTERAQEQECLEGVALLPVRRRPRSDALASRADQRISIGAAKYRIAG
jgi:transposase-like protein